MVRAQMDSIRAMAVEAEVMHAELRAENAELVAALAACESALDDAPMSLKMRNGEKRPAWHALEQARSALSGPSPEPSAVPEIHTPEPSERVGKMDPYEAAMDHLRTQNAELVAALVNIAKASCSVHPTVNRLGDMARAAVAKAKGDDA